MKKESRFIKKNDYFSQNFISDDKDMLMIIFSNLSVFDRWIMYSINFDRKEISAKSLIKINQTIKIMNSKKIYQYIKTDKVKFYETENQKLNFKRKHEIRNSSKIQSMKINALFQNLIKRSKNIIYWKKMIAYSLNMKKKLKTKFKFQRQKKNVLMKLIFWKKISISELTSSVFLNQNESFFLFSVSKFKIKKSKLNTEKMAQRWIDFNITEAKNFRKSIKSIRNQTSSENENKQTDQLFLFIKIQNIFIQFVIVLSNKTQNDFVSNDFVFTFDIVFVFDDIFIFITFIVPDFTSDDKSFKQKFKYKKLFKWKFRIKSELFARKQQLKRKIHFLKNFIEEISTALLKLNTLIVGPR